MGKRGPAPTPAGVLQMRGTFREDRHGGVEPQGPLLTKPPTAPKYLGDLAKKFWRQKAKFLVSINVLTEGDLASLEGYCVAHERAIQAEEAVAKCATGRMMPTAEGFKRHPELLTAEKARGDMRRYEQEFGLTPSARARLRAPGKPKAPAENAFTKIAEGASRKPA